MCSMPASLLRALLVAYSVLEPVSASGLDGAEEACPTTDSAKSAMMLQKDRSQDFAQGDLCQLKEVQSACYEFTGEKGWNVTTPLELAEAFNTDLASVQKLLKTMDFNKTSLKCSTLCSKVSKKIPSKLRPPKAHVGYRLDSTGKLLWDVDLSPAFLNSVEIPDEAPEHAHEAADKKAKLLQMQGSRNSSAHGVLDTAYTPDPVGEEELLYLVAQAFFMYPANADVFNKAASQSLLEKSSAPDGFHQATQTFVMLAQSWMAQSLKNFNAYHLPKAYEKWLGHSETKRHGVTKQGCTCMKTWSSSGGHTVNDYCGNPDNDAGGDWCLVTKDATGEGCQGTDWGYCAPKGEDKTLQGCSCKAACQNHDKDPGGPWCMVKSTACQGTNWGTCQSLCGPECQKLRVRLVETERYLTQLSFKWDGTAVGAFAYIRAGSTTKAHISVHNADQLQGRYRASGKALLTDTTFSTEDNGRKVVYLCPAWWNLIKDCKDDIRSCSRYNLGTAIGTIVHETMHHTPMGFDDYLYYRKVVEKFVTANRMSPKAMKVVRDCADCVEYFIADNNDYTNTGR